MEYEIQHNGKPTGKAEVREAGLYFLVRCICKDTNEIQRVVARCKNGVVNIGICAPAGRNQEVVAKIPKKRLQNIEGFFIELVDYKNNWLPLNEGQPVDALEKILAGRISVREGKIGVDL